MGTITMMGLSALPAFCYQSFCLFSIRYVYGWWFRHVIQGMDSFCSTGRAKYSKIQISNIFLSFLTHIVGMVLCDQCTGGSTFWHISGQILTLPLGISVPDCRHTLHSRYNTLFVEYSNSLYLSYKPSQKKQLKWRFRDRIGPTHWPLWRTQTVYSSTVLDTAQSWASILFLEMNILIL